jgi:hypothetical protein
MKKIVLLTLSFFAISLAMGSHLRCGYITARPESCSLRDYRITITVYTNTGSEVQFGEDGVLNFGDGTTMLVPRVTATPRPDLGPDIGMAQFTVRHVYPNLGTFLISYTEPSRNGGVLNMNDSFFTTFYLETSIQISTEYGCTKSPEFLSPSVLQAAAGTEFTYSMGVSSSEDNLITYELATPFRDRGLPVIGYIKPANLAINYLTGLLTWDTRFPGSTSQPQPGEYNFAIQANQLVKTGDTYTKIGFIRIDFQVIVNGDVDEPVIIQDNQTLDEYSRLLVPEGEEKKIKVFVESTETPTLQTFSELVGNESYSFETYDSTHDESTFKVGVLTINPNAALVRENPYLITVRSTSGGLGSDINYLIYTEEILELPVITPPVITAAEKEVDEIEVYPNPASEQITIRLNQSGMANLKVFTAQGQPVRTKSFESETTVTLSDFPPGMYICEVRRNNIPVRRIKLIKSE